MKYLKNHRELYKEYIIIQRRADDNLYGEEYNARKYREHLVWRFPNDWGASLSCSSMTSYTPELAVLRYKNEEPVLSYSTSITSDVIPGVTVPDLALLLARIQGLANERT